MEDFEISIPMPYVSQVQIEHDVVDTEKETLEVWKIHEGDSKAAL